MTKHALLLLAMLALATAGSASANHDPVTTGVRNLSPWSCNDVTNGQYVDSSGNPVTFSSASVLRVTYGWGALQQSQLNNFLKVQSGSVVVRNSSGDLIVDDAWNEGETTGYSPYFSHPLTPPGGGTTKSGWSTHKHTYLDGDPSTAENQPLPAGTYTLDFTLAISKTLNDGMGSARPEDLTPITGCRFVVA